MPQSPCTWTFDWLTQPAGLTLRRDIQIDKITLSGRGRALGYCVQRPVREMTLRTQQDLEGQLIMTLAGRAAEQVILGTVSNGAADDLERATTMARDMVCRFGFGQTTGLMVPPRSTDPGHRSLWPGRARCSVRQGGQGVIGHLFHALGVFFQRPGFGVVKESILW